MEDSRTLMWLVHIRVNKRVFLVVRPETIRIESSGEAKGVNRFKGAIKSTMYAGSMVKYTVEIQGKDIVIDQYDPSGLGIHEIGSEVVVTLPQKIHILQR